jgi:hypothetical protein
MSEEPKIFRSGQDPEQGLAQKSVPAAKAPAPVPTVDAPVVPKPAMSVTPASVATPAPPAPVPPAPAPAPEPALDFHLDDSQLFHTQEGVKQRMARLASIAHSTSDLLDEQAAETARIAKRLKSL